jgi:hypothetical protein
MSQSTVEPALPPPRRRSAIVVFLRALIGPALGGVLGTAVALALGAEFIVAAGHGIAHSREAAGLFLGAWVVAIVIGGSLGVCAFLLLSTVVRLLAFAFGRRPWPWSGSVHAGALAVAVIVALSSRGCGTWLGSRAGDTAELYQFFAYVVGGIVAGPAMIIGGAVAGAIHRLRRKR